MWAVVWAVCAVPRRRALRFLGSSWFAAPRRPVVSAARAVCRAVGRSPPKGGAGVSDAAAGGDGEGLDASRALGFFELEARAFRALVGDLRAQITATRESFEDMVCKTNEDMERTRDEKAAAVHFMRFELGDSDIASLKSGESLFMGIDHGSLPGIYEVAADQRTALIADLA